MITITNPSEKMDLTLSSSITGSPSHEGPSATGQLEDSGRQNDEKMSRKTGNAQSRATFFLHSAFLSLPAVLLRKIPIILSVRLYARCDWSILRAVFYCSAH